MMQVVDENMELLSPDKFVFWLQGFCEINGSAPNEQQWNIIKEHLELCFKKVTVREIQKEVKINNDWTPPDNWNEIVSDHINKKTTPYPLAIC